MTVPIDENGDPVAPTEREVTDRAEAQARCFHERVSYEEPEPENGIVGYAYCHDCESQLA